MADAAANKRHVESDDTGPAMDISSSEMIVQDVIKGLYEGRFAPGQRLIEADMTRRYGVGRGSVREALSRLAADGVVTLERHRGAYIKSVSRDKTLESLALLEVLSGLSARLAAQHISTPGAADRLRSALTAVLRFDPTISSVEYGRARTHFFDTLNDIGRNRELARIKASLQLCLVGSEARGRTKLLDSTRAQDFTDITDAVLAGSEKAAEKAGRKHVRRVFDVIEATPPETFGGVLSRPLAD